MPDIAASLHLQVLGTPIVRRSGDAAAAALLCEPRPLGLLIFLVTARPRGLHTRDSLLTLFWPDADLPHARKGLRNALHAIRRATGHDLLVAAGHSMLGVNPIGVHCDLIQFEEAAARGDCNGASMAPDALLDGFHVVEAPTFDRWMEQERARYRELLQRALWQHAAQCVSHGDADAALVSAHRAQALDGTSERSLLRLIELQCACGDRAAALREYERFSTRLRDDFETVPSAGTRAMVEQLRLR